jgi:hypothetical protein
MECLAFMLVAILTVVLLACRQVGYGKQGKAYLAFNILAECRNTHLLVVYADCPVCGVYGYALQQPGYGKNL